MLLGAWAGLCLALLAPSSVFASNANDFLPGAKMFGMGYSYTALADDVYAPFYNPAATANTPYMSLGGSVARLDSPRGPLTSFSGAYLRPYEPINTATVGMGYSLGRQVNGLDKDEFLAHYSQEFKMPSYIPLTRPLRAGANVTMVNEQGVKGAGFGFLGLDAAMQLRSTYGLTTSLGFKDLFIFNPKIHPTLSLASAYTIGKWLTFAGDMRVRASLTEFYPGMEMKFLQGLISARVGKGFQLDGVRQIAFGVGVNLSPVILDVGATLPTSRLSSGGAYEFSMTYRFGAPSFAGSFVGEAAQQAETLRSQIEQLKDKQQTEESKAKAAEVKREIAEGELRVVEQRVRETQDLYRAAQKRADEASYDAEAAVVKAQAVNMTPPQPPMIRKRVPKPAPGPLWPRRHEVVPGDTLRTLAQKYYGDPSLWEKIYEANRDKIDRGLPQEGSTFLIPDPSR